MTVKVCFWFRQAFLGSTFSFDNDIMKFLML